MKNYKIVIDPKAKTNFLLFSIRSRGRLSFQNLPAVSVASSNSFFFPVTWKGWLNCVRRAHIPTFYFTIQLKFSFEKEFFAPLESIKLVLKMLCVRNVFISFRVLKKCASFFTNLSRVLVNTFQFWCVIGAMWFIGWKFNQKYLELQKFQELRIIKLN